MIVSELIKKLETIENKEQIVYVVSNKQDSREQSFNHRSTRLQNIETFSGFEMGYEHMSGVFLQGEGKNSEKDLWEEEKRVALEETKNIDKWGKK